MRGRRKQANPRRLRHLPTARLRALFGPEPAEDDADGRRVASSQALFVVRDPPPLLAAMVQAVDRAQARREGFVATPEHIFPTDRAFGVRLTSDAARRWFAGLVGETSIDVMVELDGRLLPDRTPAKVAHREAGNMTVVRGVPVASAFYAALRGRKRVGFRMVDGRTLVVCVRTAS